VRRRYGNSSGVYGNRERLASHAERVQEETTCTQLTAANMQALADAAAAYAQNEAHQPHPDVAQARAGLLMAEPELVGATQLTEWMKTNPQYPVFGITVKDKDNLFARCHGTVVGKAEWRSTGLFVSDVRFVFPSQAHCQAYFQAAMVGHPELFFDADDGSLQPRMVEMQSPDKSFHVGDMCRTFCGPTALAREKLMASVAAGKTMEELQLIAERAIKTVHLLYLFCVVSARQSVIWLVCLLETPLAETFAGAEC